MGASDNLAKVTRNAFDSRDSSSSGTSQSSGTSSKKEVSGSYRNNLKPDYSPSGVKGNAYVPSVKNDLSTGIHQNVSSSNGTTANPFTSNKQSFTESTQNYGANLAAAEAALQQAKDNFMYVTDEVSNAEATKALNEAQAAYDQAKMLAQENAHKYINQAEADIAQSEGQPLPDIGNLNEITLQNGTPKIGEQETIPGRGQKPVYTNPFVRTGVWLGESAKAAGLGAVSGFTGTARVAQEAGIPAQIARNFDDATEIAWALASAYKNQIADPEFAHEEDNRVQALETRLRGSCDAIDSSGSVYEQIIANAKKAAEDMLKPETDLNELYNNFNQVNMGEETNFDRAAQATSELANELSQQSAEATESAKSMLGDTGLGNVLTDVTVNAIQMAIDRAVVSVGGTSTGSLGARVAGSKAQQAEAEGATFEQQVKAASLSAGVEIFTEKFADGLAGAYGKGYADDLVDEIIRKLSTTDRGRTALKFLASGTSEAIEEIFSAAVEPGIDSIYKEDAKKSYTTAEGRKELLADAGYSALIGFILGEAGATVEHATGSIDESVANMKAADAIQQNLQQNGMDAKSAIKTAPAVAKALQGEDLTKSQAKAINNQLVQSLYGEKLNAAKGVAQNATATSETPTAPAEQAEAEGRTAPAQAATNIDTTPEINAAAEVAGNPVETAQTDIPTPESAQAAPITQPAQAEPETPARTIESIQAELDPLLAEIATIDKDIANATEDMKQAIKNAPNSDERVIAKGQGKQAIDILNAEKAKIQKQVDALMREQKAIKSAENQAARLSPEREIAGARKPINPTPETHIDNRTMDTVGNRGTNAFQYDNPEIKPFYKRAAEILMRDLGYSQSSMRTERGKGTVTGATNHFLDKVKGYFGSTTQAIEACEQIIYDKGRENFADPKRIELLLDEMLTNGYDPVDSSLPPVQASADYMNLKGRLQGGTEYNPRERAIQSEIDNDFTEETTREIAERIVDERKARTGFYDDVTRDGQEDTSLNEGRKSFDEIDAEDTASLESKYNSSNNTQATPTTEATAEAAAEAAEATEGTTAESPTATAADTTAQPAPATEGTPSGIPPTTEQGTEQGTPTAQPTADTEGAWIPPVRNSGPAQQKVSQTSTNSMRNTAEQNGATQEDLYYTTISEYESLTNAMNRVAADKVGEMDRLAHKEMWTGEDGDAAHIIYSQLAKQFANNPNDPDIKKAYDAWGKILQEHKTRNAQALQASAKWARSGAAALLDINSEIDASENLTQEQKDKLKNDVAKFMSDFDSIDDTADDAADKYRKLILEQNKYRKTGTFRNKNFEKLLNEEADVEWLKEYARRQALNIPSDYTVKPSLGQKLKTWQVNSQLIRLGTFIRNLGGNASFGVIDTFAQDAFGYAIDSAVAKATGKKEVGFDASWLSKNNRDAAIKAMNRSILEVAGDVDMTGNTNAYGTTSSRTFKMAGNKVQRVMSRWEQLLGYSLTTSDRFFRGEIEQSITESLMNQGMEESEAQQLAKQMADYRLFQNNGMAAGISKGIHNIFNLAGVGGEVNNAAHGREGGFGVGDLLNPYPGVPANLAVKPLEYSPANIVKGAIEIVKLLMDAKAGKAVTGQQMTAVMDIARGMTGTAVVALFTALAKSGLFKNSDDEDDYDVMAENSAQNLSGIQWNLSATKRAMDGEAADWKDGDTLMKVSWLEPLNAFMAIGTLLADSEEDFDAGNLASLYFEGAVNAALDMPVMENIQNAYNTMRYSTAEGYVGKIAEGGAQLAGDAIGGMIPAPFSQVARVADDYVRDTKGDTKTQTSVNAIINNIPALRNMLLPVKTDNFGNPRMNEPDMYNRLMNSFVRPGAISTYTETAVQDEIRNLYETTGDTALFPDRNGPKSIKYGDETYKLTADESRAYHEFAGQKSEEYVNALLGSEYYSNLTDEQKTAAIKEVYSLAKDLAKAEYLKDKAEDYTNNGTNLLNGVEKSGDAFDKTALDEKNVADYVAYTQAFNDAVKSGDYAKIDEVIKLYNGLNSNTKTVLSEQATNLDNLREYSKLGLDSETFFEVRDTRKEARDTLDESYDTAARTRFLGLAMADIPEAQKGKIINGVEDYIGSNGRAAYNALSKHGMQTSDVFTFFDMALNCKTWKDTNEAVDLNGKLTPDATAFALMNTPGLTDEQRNQIFSDIKHEVSNYYNDWKNYTYAQEVAYVKRESNKASYSIPSTASASTGTSKPTAYPQFGTSGTQKKTVDGNNNPLVTGYLDWKNGRNSQSNKGKSISLGDVRRNALFGGRK